MKNILSVLSNISLRFIQKGIFLFLLGRFLTLACYSQNIGISTTGAVPDVSAMLDIVATNKGLLIPRITLTSTTSNAPVGASISNSLLVYNTATVNDVTPGYYYWDVDLVPDQWVRLLNGGAPGTAWQLTGNTGTVDGTHFLGTTDNMPLNFKVNGQKAGRIENDAATANTFFGYKTGIALTTGDYNTANGYEALFANTTGSYNLASGYWALRANTSGSYNTATGARALLSNTTGDYNTAIGAWALTANNVGIDNIAIGAETLVANNTGSDNIAVGSEALHSNTSGFSNTATGRLVMYSNTTGNYNTATGASALRTNSTGNYNTATGYQALYSNVTGSNATAIGYNAMRYANNTAIAFTNYNVALGFEALRGSTTASSNTGIANTALGALTLFANTTGDHNTASGMEALYSNTTGDYNTATGRAALYFNATGNQNIASGEQSLFNNITGSRNTAMGFNAGRGVAANSYANNCIFGYEAGYSLTTGSDNNVFIGYQAGYSEGGANKLYIDNSNTATPLIYGDFSTNRLGIDRVPTANTLEISGDASKAVASGWAANSDRRIKTDIQDIDNALAIVMKLHPVKFKYSEEWKKRNSFIQNHDRYYYNYIAQEYREVFPESVKGSGEFLDGDEEEILQIDTYNTQIVAIKAIQELKLENNNLKADIEIMKMEIEKLRMIGTKFAQQGK